MHERIKKLRKTLEMTQAQFAENIFLSQSHIAQLEQNSVNITKKTIDLICLKYNVNEDWLRYGKGEMLKKKHFVITDWKDTENLTNLEIEILQNVKLLNTQQQDLILNIIIAILKNQTQFKNGEKK